jgi:hypothetical protein
MNQVFGNSINTINAVNRKFGLAAAVNNTVAGLHKDLNAKIIVNHLAP